MIFNLLKPNAPLEGKLNEVFNIDSFKEGVVISRTQLTELLDAHKYKAKTKSTLLHQALSNYIFINMGGTESTPISEVATFCYLMYNTDSFNFKRYSLLLRDAINIDNTFLFFEDNDIVVPGGFITMVANILNDSNTMDVITNRHSFTVDSTINDIETVNKFINALGEDVHKYLIYMGNINNALKL